MNKLHISQFADIDLSLTDKDASFTQNRLLFINEKNVDVFQVTHGILTENIASAKPSA